MSNGQTSIEDYPPMSIGRTAVAPDGGIWLYQPNVPGGMIQLVAPTPAPPVNTVAPVITVMGEPDLIVGATFACSEGTWDPAAETFAYQWQSGGTAIPGATDAEYTAQESDVGNSLTCVVTGTNADGSASATSNALGPIAEPPDPETRAQRAQQPQSRSHAKHGKGHHARSVHR